MPNYKVKQGDCISSIAQNHGLFWQTVWNHPNNSGLKEKRKDPNILYPGDVVFVPDKEERDEACATEQRHQFRCKGVPAKLRLRFTDLGEPRANVNYTIDVDGYPYSGITDADGMLEISVPPDAEKAVVLLENGQDRYEFSLGSIDPVDTITGIQMRLNNLGYECGLSDGELGPMTRKALKHFQAYAGILQSGDPDEQTRSKLQSTHGC